MCRDCLHTTSKSHSLHFEASNHSMSVPSQTSTTSPHPSTCPPHPIHFYQRELPLSGYPSHPLPPAPSQHTPLPPPRLTLQASHPPNTFDPVPHCVYLKHLRPLLHPDRSLNPGCILLPRHFLFNRFFLPWDVPHNVHAYTRGKQTTSCMRVT